MNDKRVDQFWQDKERELGCALVLRTFAVYREGVLSQREPAEGLFYLMENGFYFETFEKPRSVFSFLGLDSGNGFRKINLHIPIRSIIDVTGPDAGKGQTRKSVFRSILGFFSPKPLPRVFIRYVAEDGLTTQAVFDTLLSSAEICGKYRMLAAAGGH